MDEKINNEQTITEGLAIVKTEGNVFYNPVQEFNRDLSISVINLFAKELLNEKTSKNQKRNKNNQNEVNVVIENENREPGVVYTDGITILEALSATGLRSIRYAKEIAGVKKIIANDLSKKAVESIRKNIELNSVENIVETSHSDAVMYMYQHRGRNEKFDVIDLDPYGCPSIFLDSAVQAVDEGGLLLITATDMAILCGNHPQTCYTKYGAISLRIRACHEMALRILLQCIESHANRYGRYIVPLLSLSADFYIRVFVRVYTSAAKCKYSTSKLSNVYHCTGCGSISLQPLGLVKSLNQDKFYLPSGPPVNKNCEHCNHRHHIGGPIWSGPLHCTEFVHKVSLIAPDRLGTWKRIQGVLKVIEEELDDVPLYYTMEGICGVLHCETPPMLIVRSALLNAGYNVSYSHANKTSLKTNAPNSVIWDIMRCWIKKNPVKAERLTEENPATFLLKKEPIIIANFEPRIEANPESRREGFVRFQENPTSHWGPGTRATAMVGEEKISKSKKNQNKRQRNLSNTSDATESKKMELDEKGN